MLFEPGTYRIREERSIHWAITTHKPEHDKNKVGTKKCQMRFTFRS